MGADRDTRDGVLRILLHNCQTIGHARGILGRSEALATMKAKNASFIAVGLALAACGKFEDPTFEDVFDADQAEPPPAREVTQHSPTRNLFWGDLHVHTAFSYDAYTFGTRALPDDAYTFMKGGTIEHALGFPIRASRPLDFGAVTDHAEYLGIPRHLAGEARDAPDAKLIEALRDGSPIRFSTLYLRRVLSDLGADDTSRQERFGRPHLQQVSASAWQRIIDAAERHNDPGRFTAFIGYEWSSMPDERNLHRNVIYRSSAVPSYPFSSLDSENPEDLWRALAYQREQGMDAIAIPHNSNVSDGLMFRVSTYAGEPLDADYAEARRENEPLVEIFQVKGTSETHPSLSPNDDLADFEIMEQMLSRDTWASEPKGSYARDALRTGLELAHTSGFNPLRVRRHWQQRQPQCQFVLGRRQLPRQAAALGRHASAAFGIAYVSERIFRVRAYGAAGLIAVWAEENTRESLFRAMRRKETYATSGPRISLRFFAGWEYPDDLLSGDWLARAYAGGVPMGGRLHGQAHSESPDFVVVAHKDTAGANLGRLQIVKAWADATGVSHEQVIDVAGSTGESGAAHLSSLWQDPEFDAALHALYYARAIEIPTPRYSTYDAVKMGVEPPEPAMIQERAVSSAIWYLPVDDTAN